MWSLVTDRWEVIAQSDTSQTLQLTLSTLPNLLRTPRFVYPITESYLKA
jgi:hypothetical protein